MKNLIRDLKLTVGHIDRHQIRLVLFLLTLALFVLAAGAPEIGSGGSFG